MPAMTTLTGRRGSLKGLALLLIVVMGGTQALSWWRDHGAAEAIADALGDQRIVLYTTQSCIYCQQAKRWLRAHDLPWDECDVERDAACQATFEAQGAPGTPITRVGTHWHLGFDPAWVAQALRTRPKAVGKPQPPVSAQPELVPSPKAPSSPLP